MPIQNEFQKAHATVIELVERFENNKNHYLNSRYQEQEARKDFLDKFFIALGWDVNHETQINPGGVNSEVQQLLQPLRQP